MASTSIKRIIDQARVQLPGVLDGTLRLELFNVLKEFGEVRVLAGGAYAVFPVYADKVGIERVRRRTGICLFDIAELWIYL